MTKTELSFRRLCLFRSVCSIVWTAFALFVSSCNYLPQHEVEPNDHFTQANPVRPNSKITGTIENPHDVDMFKLEVTQETAVLSAHVGGIRDIDFVLSIQDQNRREIKRFDETGIGGDEEALDIGVRRGVYYIVLSNKNEKANNPTQKYALEVKLESSAGRELEPNDTMLQATPLVPGGVMRGHYWPTQNLLSSNVDKGEEDWFRVDLATGVYALNIDLSEVPNVDPILEIYDANAYKIKEIDNGGAGEGEILKDFGMRGPAQYFLRLRAKQQHSGNPDVFYELLTELVPYRGETEFEPNDRRTDATPFDHDSITGTINPKGDEDWYRIAIDNDARQILTANLSALPGMELEMDFCDELGHPVIRVNNGGLERPQVLTGIGVAKGTYYIVVYEKTRQKADPRKRYTLTKTIVPYQPGMEYESNDTQDAAQSVKVGESVDGFIAPKGDVDWYQFNVYRKGTVFGDATGIPNVRLVMSLFDQENHQLQVISGNQVGDPVSFQRDMNPGTYFIRLQAADSEQNNVRDKYTLRLRAQ